MSLTTIMSHTGLAGYAIAGMVVFMAVFASILLRLWLQSRNGRLEEAGRMPLDDGRPAGEAASRQSGAPAGTDHASGKREERR